MAAEQQAVADERARLASLEEWARGLEKENLALKKAARDAAAAEERLAQVEHERLAGGRSDCEKKREALELENKVLTESLAAYEAEHTQLASLRAALEEERRRSSSLHDAVERGEAQLKIVGELQARVAELEAEAKGLRSSNETTERALDLARARIVHAENAHAEEVRALEVRLQEERRQLNPAHAHGILEGENQVQRDMLEDEHELKHQHELRSQRIDEIKQAVDYVEYHLTVMPESQKTLIDERCVSIRCHTATVECHCRGWNMSSR